MLATGAILLASGLVCQTANAALLITFYQDGSDVKAVTSGELSVGTGTLQVADSSALLDGSSTSLQGVHARSDQSTYDIYSGGSSTDSDLIASPDYFTGDTFGYTGTQVIANDDIESFDGLDDDNQIVNVLNPSTTWVWENTTLSDIGLGGLSTTSEVVYTSSAGDTISFASTTSVPEPSSILMLALGAVGFTLRRRR